MAGLAVFDIFVLTRAIGPGVHPQRDQYFAVDEIDERSPRRGCDYRSEE
jgi:hypothetical protein